MIIWRIHIAYWITKATHTQSEYVILIAFPLQQWLHEGPQCYVIRTLPVLLSLLTRKYIISIKYFSSKVFLYDSEV